MANEQPIYINLNDTVAVFKKGLLSGGGSLSRIATLDAPTVLVGLYVRSITGVLNVTIKTRTGTGVEKTMVTFDPVTAPTAELVLEKVINSFRVVEFIAEYSGDCDFELWTKGAEGSETPIFASQPIPIDVELGDPLRFKYRGDTTPGAEQKVIDETVNAGQQWRFSQLLVNCRTEGHFYIKIDGVFEGEGFTNPSKPNACLYWEPLVRAEATKTVEVFFKAVSSVRIAPLGVYLRGNIREL